jgi:hypothetical protein
MNSEWAMTSLKTDIPAQLRARAEDARQKAQAEPDESIRKRLLIDANLWEQMAFYEEKHPLIAFSNA